MKDLSEIEILREKLHSVIDEEGETSPKVLNQSQELDKLILSELRRSVNEHKG